MSSVNLFLHLAVIAGRLSEFRQQCVKGQCSLPKLRSFDWRIDLQTSSNYVTDMSTPCVLVQMEVDKPQQAVQRPMTFQGVDRDENTQNTETVNFELSQASLATMLEGLGKIRDQLNSVANKPTAA